MLIATTSNAYRLREDETAAAPVLLFEGEKIQCLQEGRQVSVLCLEGGEIALLADDQTRRLKSGIQEPIECLALLEEDPLHLLLGTEAPHLYRLKDDERPAQSLKAFDELECRDAWYTPWGGPPAVRSLARSHDWVYADIHVGSIMRSSDLGASWEPVQSDLHEDVHQVATAPVLAQRVYANTAAAVYRSEDRGASWQACSAGLSARYGRAIAVHPADPDCLLASVSKGPHSPVEGKLHRSDDAGRTWTHVTAGFPASTRNNIDTFQLAFSGRGTAWAAVEETLYKSEDRGESWEAAWKAPEPIGSISCALAE
jgi:hypothetical protein